MSSARTSRRRSGVNIQRPYAGGHTSRTGCAGLTSEPG
jgi:hypothetical protein